MFSDLSQQLSHPLKHWQIAFNGVWENAIEITPGAGPEEVEKIREAIQNGAQDTAIEAFFGDRESGDFFFLGIRIASLSKDEQINFVLGLIKQEAGQKLPAIIQAIKNQLPEKNVMQDNPDFLELGVEGLWKSTGPHTVWKNGQEKPEPTTEKIHAEAPHLTAPFNRALMMEMAWKQPFPTWVGVPVSSKNGNQFMLDGQKYHSVLSTVLDIT